MEKIVSPLKPQMKRPQVADLQQALMLIGLQIADVEKDIQRYGVSTKSAVCNFQTKHQLPVTGIVDEATANTLNSLLEEHGVLDKEAIYTVDGVVLCADEKPAVGFTVNAFDRDVSREALLGVTVTDQGGTYRIVFAESQFKKTPSEQGRSGGFYSCFR